VLLAECRSSVDGESLANGENEQSEAHRGTTNGNDDALPKEDGKLSRIAPVWLAESTPNEFTVRQFLYLGILVQFLIAWSVVCS